MGNKWFDVTVWKYKQMRIGEYILENSEQRSKGQKNSKIIVGKESARLLHNEPL